MKKLHKMVNGKKVDLTEEEEIAIKAEWDANRLKQNAARLKAKADKEKREQLKSKLAEKLEIDVEEVELLIRGENGLLGA